MRLCTAMGVEKRRRPAITSLAPPSLPAGQVTHRGPLPCGGEPEPFEQLLATFWAEHDPTQVDRQGPDVGKQYRSVIFVDGDDQRAAAEASRAQRSRPARRPGRATRRERYAVARRAVQLARPRFSRYCW